MIPPVVYDHVRLDRFAVALHYAIVDFQEIIDYRDQSSPRTVVFLHTYDYVYPSGIPWKPGPINEGPWIKPSLEAVGLTDSKEQRVLTSWLVDQFAEALQAFASTVKDVRIIDSRGTLTSLKQWSNEIHPTKAGFALIATQRWAPQLDPLLS